VPEAKISLEQLQENNRELWAPHYWHPDRHDDNQKLMERRIDDLGMLGVDRSLIDPSRAHLELSFGVFRGEEASPYHGGYAFVAPTRIERASKLDYTAEASGPYPLMDRLDQPAAQVFLAAQAPCLLDWYGDDSNKPEGVMVFAPLFMDMLRDFETDSLLADPNFVKDVMNATVAFARDRAGARYAGLAAVLPALTRFGMDITEEGVSLSTGHAGTVFTMEQTAIEIINQGLGNVPRGDFEHGLTIIGLGGIGLSTAVSLRERLPGIPLHVYDDRILPIERAREQLNGSVTYHSTLADAMNATRLTLSAVTGQLDLSGVKMEGLVVVDDSQPGSVDQEVVRGAGGFVVGVYADGGSNTRRHKFDYAGICAVGETETFSCHANVAAISRRAAEGDNVDDLCFRRPVNPDDVARVQELFERSNTGIAPLQWGYGKYHAA